MWPRRRKRGNFAHQVVETLVEEAEGCDGEHERAIGGQSQPGAQRAALLAPRCRLVRPNLHAELEQRLALARHARPERLFKRVRSELVHEVNVTETVGWIRPAVRKQDLEPTWHAPPHACEIARDPPLAHVHDMRLARR